MDRFWFTRLALVKAALEGNGFIAHIAEDGDAACRLMEDLILPAAAPASMSWGGSTTVVSLGLYNRLKDRQDVQIIDTFDKTASREEILERRRHALLVDLFITGSNAVTEDGSLVNLDMIGNRVAALAYGPRQVVVLVGRNKIVSGLSQAMERIKTIAAPANTMRLDKKTPCAVTGRCQDCKSQDRICHVWTITEKSFPKGRITVVLINQELGF
ncbi:lactate utilization protein [Desulfocurvibacter africanus]|uniref:lactate utilization protein n=1 Tax=Desulfocurvibacter africanus TaxID=873 RepID=UPI002FD8CFD9